MFTDAPQEGYFLIYLFFDRFFFSFLEEEMINYRTNTVYDSHSFHQKRFSLLNTVVAKKKKKNGILLYGDTHLFFQFTILGASASMHLIHGVIILKKS